MAPPPLQLKSIARPRSCMDDPGMAVGGLQDDGGA
jgi:hypothetical protein